MKVGKLLLFVMFLALLVAVVLYFVDYKKEQLASDINVSQPDATNENETNPDNVSQNHENSTNDQEEAGQDPTSTPTPEPDPEPTVEPDTDAKSVSVIVNPNYKLPDNYEPDDLVYPEVRFIFNEKIEKRMLREEAAKALESMFEAAEVDGIYLAGVSGYRSHSTQTALFNRYVERDGYDVAKTYSAEPGTSEHETGLAIDVTSSDGKCAAQDCFGGTVEAIWLENNAQAYGFIIRYPKGKEDITGYKYEPWHIRYVGVELAQQLHEQGLTLEEYYDVEPVKR
ncbi:D-alanyl-D-alanine carboxypeptidase family protein [Paenibacillus septentrionalis]|uniref:D-alanyl-D-alanine carboxypeptidase family protein n=1 Tax=Paenibacillus septentrionalis TaxID=429342 RepID=A0ABW1V915_9BACL